MSIITLHGFQFDISGDGWAGHEADQDRAEDAAETMLRRLNATSVAALWAAAAHRGRAAEFDGRSHPVMDRLTSIEHRAAKLGSKGWMGDAGCYISIDAIAKARGE